MKLLLTGASGFIGREVTRALAREEVELHAVSSRAQPPLDGVSWHISDLLTRGISAELVRAVRPTHILHLAWNAVPGIYWTSPDNLRWVESSLELLGTFANVGGVRAVFAGTCAEYDWSHPLCVEDRTPTRPSTFYGCAKHSLQLLTEATARQTGISTAWGRIFSLYGPHEHRARLVPSLSVPLLEGREAICGSPLLVRDYLHVSDVASAFVALLRSDIQGPVNISSANAHSVGQIAQAIADKLGRGSLLRMTNRPRPPTEPERLIGDNARLLSTGWRPTFDLDMGLNDTLNWWRSHYTDGGPPSC